MDIYSHGQLKKENPSFSSSNVA